MRALSSIVAPVIVAASAGTAAAPPRGEAGHRGPEWGYAGASGPDHWAELADQYRVCSQGQQESPIDLAGAIPARLGNLRTAYRLVSTVVENTGHSIQLDLAAGGTMSVGGRSYDLVQGHFHHPSEHLLEGRRFPLEGHFVHRLPSGGLGVVAVFYAEGQANAAFANVLSAMPAKRGRGVRRIRLAAADLMPPNRTDFLRYEGSLTTPPCSETVDWVVLGTPVAVSAAQVKAFARIYPFNARPLQPLNRRFLLRSE